MKEITTLRLLPKDTAIAAGESAEASQDLQQHRPDNGNSMLLGVTGATASIVVEAKFGHVAGLTTDEWVQVAANPFTAGVQIQAVSIPLCGYALFRFRNAGAGDAVVTSSTFQIQ